VKREKRPVNSAIPIPPETRRILLPALSTKYRAIKVARKLTSDTAILAAMAPEVLRKVAKMMGAKYLYTRVVVVVVKGGEGGKTKQD